MESIVYSHQQDYYAALNASTNAGNSTPFIEFMLQQILEALKTLQVTPQVETLLKILKGSMTRQEILDALNLKDRKSLRQRYLQPAMKQGLIEMTIPDKPNSRLQKYRRASRTT